MYHIAKFNFWLCSLGDSGGPLFDNNNTQIGIVSYGIGCARRQEDVYASVGGFYNWIQAQIMAEDICNPVETDDDNFIDENALDLGDVVGSLSRLCEAVSWAFQGIIGFFRGG